MRILIVDRNAMLRQEYRHALANDFHEAMFGEAATWRQTILLLERVRWDVVVLGPTPSRRDRLDGLRQIREADPHLPVLLLGDGSESPEALRIGASACVTTTEAMIAAVRTTLDCTDSDPTALPLSRIT